MPIKECDNLNDNLESAYVSSTNNHLVWRELVFSGKSKRYMALIALTSNWSQKRSPEVGDKYKYIFSNVMKIKL